MFDKVFLAAWPGAPHAFSSPYEVMTWAAARMSWVKSSLYADSCRGSPSRHLRVGSEATVSADPCEEPDADELCAGSSCPENKSGSENGACHDAGRLVAAIRQSGLVLGWCWILYGL